MRTLLLGMGNPILSDDAVGVRLATDFRAQAGPVQELEIVEECSVGGLNLLDLLSGFQRVILLDSLQTSTNTPGAWHRFTATTLCDTVHLTNVHDTNFATALELGRRIGMPLPDLDEIHIFGVEIRDNFTFSEEMTPALEQVYPDLKAAIFKALCELLPGRVLGPKDWLDQPVSSPILNAGASAPVAQAAEPVVSPDANRQRLDSQVSLRFACCSTAS